MLDLPNSEMLLRRETISGNRRKGSSSMQMTWGLTRYAFVSDSYRKLQTVSIGVGGGGLLIPGDEAWRSRNATVCSSLSSISFPGCPDEQRAQGLLTPSDCWGWAGPGTLVPAGCGRSRGSGWQPCFLFALAMHPPTAARLLLSEHKICPSPAYLPYPMTSCCTCNKVQILPMAYKYPRVCPTYPLLHSKLSVHIILIVPPTLPHLRAFALAVLSA